MYAVFMSGSKQHRVSPGEQLYLERIDAAPGEEISFDDVMLIADDEEISVGSPYLPNGKVNAKIVRHDRAPKIRVVKFKRRKNYLRRAGHRQHRTLIEVTSITN